MNQNRQSLRRIAHGFLFLLICRTVPCIGFNTLAELQQFIDQNEEYPAPDNTNLLAPDYSSFYHQTIPSWIDGIARLIGIKSKPLWDVQYFKNILEHITQSREKNGYYGRFVEKIIPQAHTQFIIFGDIHGSLHSLTRDLEELAQQKIIDNNFKLIKDNTYLIFNGNVIDLSPYILETITLVLDLMRNNPARVIYIRGKHEEKEFWYNFGLRQELEIKARKSGSEHIPLDSLIKRFFNTLPLAYYLAHNNGSTIDVVRISPTDRKNPEIDEHQLSNFFEQKDNNPDIFDLVNKAPSTRQIDVRAMIKVEERLAIYSPSKGLLNIAPDQGATAWITLSSPNRTHRTLYEFFYDAFTVLTTAPSLQDWTISLYNRDVRDVLGFSRSATYNLLTGQKIATPPIPSPEADTRALEQEIQQLKQAQQTLTQELATCKILSATALATPSQPSPESYIKTTTNIVIGTSLDLSRGLAEIGRNVRDGLIKAFEKINREGGIKGRHVRLIVLDHENNPTIARDNIKKLKQDYHVDIILSAIGSTAISGFLDLVKNKEILLLFPNALSAELRDPNLSHIIHLASSAQELFKGVVDYINTTFRVHKFAFVLINDQNTRGIQEYLASSAMKNFDVKLFLHDPKSMDFTEIAQQIVTFEPATIGLITPGRSATEIIRRIGVENLINKHIFAIRSDDPLFKNFLENEGLEKQFIDGENFPNPRFSDLEIVQEYQREMGDDNLNIFSLEGYISAALFADIAKQISGDISMDNIITIIENIKNYQFKGLQLNFDPTTRQLYHTIWINTGAQAWLPRVMDKAPLVSDTPKKEFATTDTTNQSTISQKSITIGATLDLSKGLREVGENTRNGLAKAVEEINQSGGINGKSVRFIALDNESDPRISRKNVEELINTYNTTIIIAPIGADTTVSLLDLVKNKKILLLFPSSGSSELRDPTLTNIIHLGSSYADIYTNLLNYAQEKLHVKKVAFFAIDNASTADLQAYFKSPQAAADPNLKLFLHDQSSTNFQPLIKEMLDFGPDAIGLFTTARAASDFIRQAGAHNLAHKRLFGIRGDDQQFRDTLVREGLAQQLINGKNFPNPNTSNLEIVQDYRKAMQNTDLTIFGLEGYISGKLFADLARRISGPITKENLVAAAEAIKNYNFKGLLLDFDPQKRQLYHTVWIDIGDTNWIPVDTRQQSNTVQETENIPTSTMHVTVPELQSDHHS